MKPILSTSGSVTINGKTFPVAKLTETDYSRIRARMRELALPSCVNPLVAVNAMADQLAPAVLQMAITDAVSRMSGGGAEPTPDAIDRAFESVKGVQFQFWYCARKANPNLTFAEVEGLITEDNRYEVADTLVAALKPTEDADVPKASPAGAPS